MEIRMEIVMRKIRLLLVVCCSVFLCQVAQAEPTSGGLSSDALGGVVTIKSEHSAIKTAQGLQENLKEKGFLIKGVIDHQEIARSLGHELRPTIGVLFGNPAYEYYLMKETQLTSLFVPLNFSTWEAESGEVYVSYWYPKHNIGKAFEFKTKDAKKAIRLMSQEMDEVAKMATKK
jgi:uncharacterized protein (DUF302 family)